MDILTFYLLPSVIVSEKCGWCMATLQAPPMKLHGGRRTLSSLVILTQRVVGPSLFTKVMSQAPTSLALFQADTSTPLTSKLALMFAMRTHGFFNSLKPGVFSPSRPKRVRERPPLHHKSDL